MLENAPSPWLQHMVHLTNQELPLGMQRPPTPGVCLVVTPGLRDASYYCCKGLMSLQVMPLSQHYKPVNNASMLNIFVSRYSEQANGQACS